MYGHALLYNKPNRQKDELLNQFGWFGKKKLLEKNSDIIFVLHCHTFRTKPAKYRMVE